VFCQLYLEALHCIMDIKHPLLVVALCVMSKQHVVLMLMAAQESGVVKTAAGTVGFCS